MKDIKILEALKELNNASVEYNSFKQNLDSKILESAKTTNTITNYFLIGFLIVAIILLMVYVISSYIDYRKNKKFDKELKARLANKNIKKENKSNDLGRKLDCLTREGLIEDIRYLNTLEIVEDKEDYIYTVCNFNNSILGDILLEAIYNNENVNKAINNIRKVLIKQVKSI